MSVLEFGLNFSMSGPLEPKKLICTVEHAIDQMDDAERDKACTCAIRILTKFAHKKHTALLPEPPNSMRNLPKNYGIVILPADKGNITVIMNTTDHISKTSDIVWDSSTYAVFERDPTLKVK